MSLTSTPRSRPSRYDLRFIWAALAMTALFCGTAHGEIEEAVVKVLALKLPQFVAPRGQEAQIPLAIPGYGHGSGVVIDGECTVITNNHVIDGAVAIAVRFEGHERTFPALIAYQTKKPDLAILVVDKEKCAEFISLTDPAKRIARRTPVYKIGYGGDVSHSEVRIRSASVKPGIISRIIEVEREQRLEISNPINPGDSGGLIHDDQNKIVGITVAKHARAEGVGYVIPASLALRTYREASSGNEIARARREMSGEKWEALRLLALVGAHMVETPQDRLDQVLTSTAQDIAELEKLVNKGGDVRVKAWLLLHAIYWNKAVLQVVVGVKEKNAALRLKGCQEVQRLREVIREEKLKTPTVEQSDFVRALFSVYLKSRLNQICTGRVYSSASGGVPGYGQRRYRQTGAACFSNRECRSFTCRNGYCAARRTYPPVPAAEKKWRFLLGDHFDFDFRWAIEFYFTPGDDGYSLTNFGLTFGLPVVGWKGYKRVLDFSFCLGYTITYLGDDLEKAFHRIEIPLRASYKILFSELGPVVNLYKIGESLETSPGFLFRTGVKKVVQAGFEYVYLPVRLEGDAAISLVGLFIGLAF